MTKRKRLIEAARIDRMMLGGPTGELHERERVLEMLGVPKIQAPRAVVRASSTRVIFLELRERSAKRRAILWGGDSENK